MARFWKNQNLTNEKKREDTLTHPRSWTRGMGSCFGEAAYTAFNTSVLRTSAKSAMMMTSAIAAKPTISWPGRPG